MTDQIYYRIQYPLKKAINIIKKVDPEDPFAGKEYNQEEVQEIRDFIDRWDQVGEAELQDLIKRLRKENNR